jgi:hypothetical protein
MVQTDDSQKVSTDKWFTSLLMGAEGFDQRRVQGDQKRSVY